MIFGLKALVGGSLFVNKLIGSNESDSTTKKNDAFFGQLDIFDIPDATNSAQIVVGGSVSEFDSVEVFLNNQMVKEVDTSEAPGFSEEIGSLKNGSNVLYFVAKSSKTSKEKISDTYTILMQTEKPNLEISSPDTEKATSSTQDYTIRGTTDPDVEVHVNRSPAVVDAAGGFSLTVRLREGENSYDIVATDMAGNSETKTVIIEYRKDE